MLRPPMVVARGHKLGKELAWIFPSIGARPAFVTRVVFYLIVTVAVFGAAVMVAVHSPSPAALFEENGPWEWTEFFLLVVSAVLCFVSARHNEIHAHVLKLCSLLALFAGFRELDHVLDNLVFDGAYKVINGVLLGLLVYLVWSHRWTFKDSLARFTKTAPFYFFMAAVLVVVYAEIIGQAELWKALMGDNYVRAVKRAVEELAEFMGYLLLVFGAAETYFLTPTRHTNRAAEEDPALSP